MSHSENYGKKTTCIHPKDAQRIVTIAEKIIERVKEPNPTAKLMAKTIVADFGDLVDRDKRLSFMEALSAAKRESAPGSNEPRNLGYTLGSELAENALKKAAAIMAKSDSFNKAVVSINRVIAAREKTHQGRMRANGRSTMATIPIDGHLDSGGRKHSQKPGYVRQQPSKAKTHRRKAA